MSVDKRVSVAIITFNAQRKLRECLDAVKWADEIVVVDSGSTDDTITIVKEYTDKIYIRQFDNFSSQKNYSISKSTNEWVLSLDADEVVTNELSAQLKSVICNTLYDGYYIERLNNFYGEFFNYGRPDYQLRFFKKSCGRFEQPVHERVRIPKKRTSKLKGNILHYTMKDIAHHVDKIVDFTDYDVKYYPVDKIGIIWMLRNLIIRPVLKFLQHYIFKKAFKDGLKGYIFTINTIMGEFITSAKYCEEILMRRK